MFHSSTAIRLTAVLVVLLCAFCFSATAQTDTTDKPVPYRFTSMITANIGASMAAGELYDTLSIAGGVSFGGALRARFHRSLYIGYEYSNQVLKYTEGTTTSWWIDGTKDVEGEDVRQHEVFAVFGIATSPARMKSPVYFCEMGAGVVTLSVSHRLTHPAKEPRYQKKFDPAFTARIMAGLILPVHRSWGIQGAINSRWIYHGLHDLNKRGWNHGFTVGLAYMMGGR